MQNFNEEIVYNEIALAFGAKMIPHNEYPHEITNTPLGELFVKTITSLSKESVTLFKFISKLKEYEPSLTAGRILGVKKNRMGENLKYNPVEIKGIIEVRPDSEQYHQLLLGLPEGAVSINANGVMWSHYSYRKHIRTDHQIDMYTTGQLMNVLESLLNQNIRLSDAYHVYISAVRRAIITQFDEKISRTYKKFYGRTGFMDGYISFAERENPAPDFIYNTKYDNPIELSTLNIDKEILPSSQIKNNQSHTTLNFHSTDKIFDATSILEHSDKLVKFNNDSQKAPNEATIEYISRVGIAKRLASGSYSFNLGVSNSAQNQQLNPHAWAKKLSQSGIPNVSVSMTTDRESIRIKDLSTLTTDQATLLIELFKRIHQIKNL